jgi:hypothetical protein
MTVRLKNLLEVFGTIHARKMTGAAALILMLFNLILFQGIAATIASKHNHD